MALLMESRDSDMMANGSLLGTKDPCACVCWEMHVATSARTEPFALASKARVLF